MTSGVADQETVRYLGFPIEVHGSHLIIRTPEGRLIFFGQVTLSTARNIIRGYRRAA